MADQYDGSAPPDLPDESAISARPKGPRLRWVALSALLVVVVWLAVGALVGVPGPGPLRRYSIHDLHEAIVVLDASDTGSWEVCPDPVWRVNWVTARVEVETWGCRTSGGAAEAALIRAGLPAGLISWPGPADWRWPCACSTPA